MRSLIYYLFILSVLLLSCAKEESTVEVIEKNEIDIQMIDAYNEGMVALDEQDGLTAAKKIYRS